MAHPSRVSLAGDFEAFCQKYEQAIHFALYSAFDNAHLGQIAIVLFHTDPKVTPPQFSFLGVRLLSHAEYFEEKLSTLDPEDPHRIVSVFPTPWMRLFS